MRPKWPFWKHRERKMVEAQCAHQKRCYPETNLGVIPLLGFHNVGLQSHATQEIAFRLALCPCFSWRTFRMFLFFFCFLGGGGKGGESEAKGGGGPFHLEFEKGGFQSGAAGVGCTGVGRVSARRGEGQIFFFRAEMPIKFCCFDQRQREENKTEFAFGRGVGNWGEEGRVQKR